MKKRYNIFFLLLLVLIFLAACIEKPEMPDWDINMYIPLMNEEYYVKDLVDSTNFVSIEDEIFFTNEGTFTGEIVPREMNINAKTSEWITVESGNSVSGVLPIDEDNVYDEVTGMYETFQIRYGEVYNWFLQIETDFSLPVNKMTLTFQDVYNEDGSQISLGYEIAGSEHTYISNLAGVNIGIKDNPELLLELPFTITLETDKRYEKEEAGQVRVFFGGDNADLGHIYFSYFEGRMMNKTFSFTDFNQSINVQYPYNLDQTIQPQGVTLNLKLYNSLGFNVILRATLKAYNDDTGDSLQIIFDENYPETITATAAPAVGDSSITIMALTETMDEFIAVIPSHIKLTDARFIASPDVATDGFAKYGTHSRGDYTFMVPFKFKILQSTITPDKIFSSEISESNQQTITDYILSAILDLELRNRLPIGTGIDIYMSTSSDTTVIFHPDDYPQYQSLYFTDVIDTIHIAAADNSFPDSSPVLSYIQLKIDEEDVDFFSNRNIYTALKFHLDESADSITIKPEDYIGVKGFVTLKAHVQEVDEEE